MPNAKGLSRRNFLAIPIFAGLILGTVGTVGTIGCGGGSGGSTGSGSTTGNSVSGRVLSIVTGGPVSPAPAVQTPRDRETATDDGSFLVGTNLGATSLTIDSSAFGIWNFTTVPASGTTDVGDLWIGPERVSVSGTVKNAASGEAIPGATILFGGRIATAGMDGTFTLSEVAYSSASPAAFLGLVGTARATGFISTQFTTNGNSPSAGTAIVGDILLSPQSDPTPPGVPYTIYGIVTPIGSTAGTIASLKNSGGTEIRRYTVSTDGRYSFFVAPGSYNLTFTRGTTTMGPYTVTLSSSTDVQRRDVSFP